MTCKHPLSYDGYDSDLLNISNYIGSRIGQVRVEDHVRDVDCNSDPLDIGNDIGSRKDLFEAHDIVIGDHLGREKTYYLVCQNY